MKPDKLVVRFINGTVMKGQTNNFFPDKTLFHLVTLEGKIIRIDTQEVKAIFFVKYYEGNKLRMDHYNDLLAGNGKIAKITFFDGEHITGFAQDYSPDSHGFFIVPTDRENNNSRVFVLQAATAKIEFRDALFDEKQFIKRDILKG